MLHPRITSVDSSQQSWLAQVGPYGAWADLAYTFRYGSGACGMFEASWSMPLPPDFEHPLLKRGTLVELMDGPWRVGSPLIMSEPARGSGLGDSWKITATGIGREVEGENSWYALDGSGNATTYPETAVDAAIARGLRWDGHVPMLNPSVGDPEQLNSIGSILNATGDLYGLRWGITRDNLLDFFADPTTPDFHVVPGVAALGTADDDYATVVLFRYLDNVTHTFATAVAPASPSAVELRYGRREFPVDRTDLGEIPAATAQLFADGILAKSKGRLGWTNGLTVTSQEIVTTGGVPADLSMVAEKVGTGCMVRLHGIYDDLLETTGNTWLDVIIGEAPYVDGASSIDLKPLGLAARDLASVVEAVSGPAVP